MVKDDFKAYNYDQLLTIAYELYKDCERLRMELDEVNNVIR